MRENLALTSLEINHWPLSLSAEEIIGLCKNKKRGFTYTFYQTTAIDFMRVLKACPHIVLQPDKLMLDCKEEEVETTIALMMKGEWPTVLKREDKGPIADQ